MAEEVFHAEIIETDINDLCRICGSTSDSPLIPIYDENGLAEDLASKIMLYLPIKVSEEDALPIKTCVNCTNGVLTWHLLYECCVDADRRFKAMFSEEQLIQPQPRKKSGKDKTYENTETSKPEENVNETNQVEEHEMEDVMFLKAEFGPEDEQYLEDETHLADGELEPKSDDQPVKHRIFKSRQQHQCNFCKEVYTSKETLTEHLRNNHYNQIFHCDICNEYKDQKDLIVHMTQHALNSLQPSQDQQQPNQPQTKSTKPKNKSIISTTGNNKLKCKKCDKIFASLNGVRYHMNSVHAKLKNFKCDKCEKAFSCKRVLDNHMKSIHIKKKVFQCDLCEKAFKTDAALYTHKKIHDNVFPYECDKCGKTFRFKHHHVSHLEIHNMVKKYACNICSKQFYAQNNLSKHMKTHETTLEYTCHLCNVKMNQRRYLYEHMKRVHQPVLNKDNSN